MAKASETKKTVMKKASAAKNTTTKTKKGKLVNDVEEKSMQTHECGYTADHQVEALEEERLFGGNVDLFVSMHCARILARVCRHGGLQDIKDDSIWESIAALMKDAEMQELVDVVVPSPVEQATFLSQYNSGRSHRFRHNSASSDLLEALYADIRNRKTVWSVLGDVMEKRAAEFEERINAPGYQPGNIQTRFGELQKCLNLNETELAILILFFLQETDRLKRGDFAVGQYRHAFDTKKLAVVAGTEKCQIAKCLDENSNLLKFDILKVDGDISNSFMFFLVGSNPTPLSERFWRKSTEEPLPWEFHGKIAEDHGQVISRMVRSKPAGNGLSILLYGAAGAGKTSFALSLGAQLGREVYFIAQNDSDHCRTGYSANFRYAALAAAQFQLDPDKCILVVDECDDMIEANRSNGFFGAFFARESGAQTKGMLNTVIDENRHTVIWICNSQQDAIATSSRRRFDYSVLFDELLPETRMRIWENSLRRYHCEGRLTPEFIAEVSHKYKVNAGGIALAVKNAASVTATDASQSFPDQVSCFLQSHCALLGIRKSNDERLEPARDYSLEGLNIKSGIRPERIIQVCRKFLEGQDKPGEGGRDRPRMNILLHGVPGSGKTEFVKYLAKSLGRKLNIKNASDLLSMYVGGTEHLLASAFAEAEKNNEILFIDEGDSMLSSRDNARHTWEVSQVNTLLNEMENFSGIFALSTNLIQRLDPAALRRFTFRVHFDFLDDSGKAVFYQTYFGHFNLPEMTAAERNQLCAVKNLTPSDFRNVRQQCFYLDDGQLSHTEIIEALAAEARSRAAAEDYKGLGETRHGIGFGS